MQPRQTDAVDQFVAQEANGYEAEGFSRQRVFISMNRMTRDARHRGDAGEIRFLIASPGRSRVGRPITADSRVVDSEGRVTVLGACH